MYERKLMKPFDPLNEMNEIEMHRVWIEFGLSVRLDLENPMNARRYKKMALLHHPTRVQVERHVTPSLRAHEQILRDQRRKMDSFQMLLIVGGAFEVLIDPMRRAIYDLYGERGLKEGIQGPDGFIPPYAYHGDPHKTFHEFFGTDNPFIGQFPFSNPDVFFWGASGGA